MINEDLKNKIIDYLDGNLDKSAEQEVEDILSSNDEANDFYNELKCLDITLNEFKTSQDYLAFSKQADEAVDEFIDNNLPSTSKQNTYPIFKNIFTRNAIGYSFTALFFLAIGINFGDLYDDTGSQYSFDLDATLFEKTELKTRSFATELDTKDLLLSTIDEMVLNNSSEGKLIYGSESYLIFLESISIISNETKCYEGRIFNNGSNVSIIYCANKNDSSLIFNN